MLLKSWSRDLASSYPACGPQIRSLAAYYSWPFKIIALTLYCGLTIVVLFVLLIYLIKISNPICDTHKI